MIRQLRLQHRRLFWILAVLLPLVFAAGIAGRSQIKNSVPSTFIEQRVRLSQILYDGASSWERTDARWVIRTDDATIRLTIDVYPGEDNVPAPDVLMYFTPSPKSQDSLPSDAVLLGAMPLNRSQQFEFPQGVAKHFQRHLSGTQASSPLGSLLLYSLARHELLDQGSITITFK